MSQRRNGRAPVKGSYEPVGNQQMPVEEGDEDQDQDVSFDETDHIRSSVVRLAGGLGGDRAPTAQEGMLRRPDSLAADTSLEIAMLESGAATDSPSRYQMHQDKNKPEEQPFFRQSDAYREAERDVMRRTLEEIEKVANKRIRDGFSELNFTLGVLNVILVSFTFGLWPQNFWLLFLVEGVLFVGAKSRAYWRSRPLNNILYLLDYCWVMNILALFVLIFFVLDDYCTIHRAKRYTDRCSCPLSEQLAAHCSAPALYFPLSVACSTTSILFRICSYTFSRRCLHLR